MRFDRAYVQSPFCGPSRMSYYTGRYCHSHGATWNGFPLRVGEPTLGDHLRPLGVRSALVGKTHMIADTAGMERLGIDPGSNIGVLQSQCGFEPFERDDGLHPDGPYDPDPDYDNYLRQHGFSGRNPWEEWANSAEGDDGEILSGWLMRYGNLPARVPDEHSETPYMTQRAIDFMETAGDQPWLCHLSYIKPHWPYIVPAPYHNMYGPEHVIPPVRSEAERQTDHPVYAAYQKSRVCRAFSRDEVRERVIPAYMGLIKQIDDQLGILFAYMKRNGLFDNTMIVMTSDHGDYLGDHWMGEKDLFFEQSVRVPLIIYDPRPEADATRGTATEELVEGIDLAPTFLEYFGGAAKPHILEGRSLSPLLHHAAKPEKWRDYVISEYDYATRSARTELGIDQNDARTHHDPRCAMEIRPLRGVSPDVVRPRNRPRRVERYRRRSGVCSGARAHERGDFHVGAAASQPDHRDTGTRRSDGQPRAAGHHHRRLGRGALPAGVRQAVQTVVISRGSPAPASPEAISVLRCPVCPSTPQRR